MDKTGAYNTIKGPLKTNFDKSTTERIDLPHRAKRGSIYLGCNKLEQGRYT
jgi:hypothetical protein